VGTSFSLSEAFLHSQTDERLCALAADGRARAFAVLVERHRDALLRTSRRVAGAERAEDAVQEALLRAYRALAEGTSVENPQAWLHKIARNAAFDQIARERGQTAPLSADLADNADIAGPTDDRPTAHDVLAQIAALPERQRTALVGIELQGRSRRDIAADLGLTEGAVRQLVHRARRAVRVAMTAFTPYPLAAWAARRGAGPGAGEVFARMAPPAGSVRSGLFDGVAAGSAAGGGALLKGSATLIAVGALSGGVAWRTLTGGHGHSRQVTQRQRFHIALGATSAAPAREALAPVMRAQTVAVASVIWHPARGSKVSRADAGDRSLPVRSDHVGAVVTPASSNRVSTLRPADGADGADTGATSFVDAAPPQSQPGDATTGDGSASWRETSAAGPPPPAAGGSDAGTSSSTGAGMGDGYQADSSGGSSPNTASQAPATNSGD